MTDVTYTEATDPETRRQDGRHVPGWGADLDPADRPAYPKERTPPRLDNVHWQSPAAQRNRHGIVVLHSNERPGLTPIYGTSTPPRGLSGLLRRLAFRYSENDLRHWLVLLAADRVNVGEGLLDDLAHGHLPNLYREMGGPAEWRHNRTGLMKKALVAGMVAGVAVYLLRRRGR
ncbi:hypothetical protein [Ramlibacter sp.]|uniref:hypothetical protein n=1 Tax=Ramlibacter sp. TaxID=1917967 RepID=UPI002D3BBB39|nr:hypothetical protein [Ramlibacter sp.]HYD75202.1 hypothetical protein [Ramlibacter sp.]